MPRRQQLRGPDDGSTVSAAFGLKVRGSSRQQTKLKPYAWREKWIRPEGGKDSRHFQVKHVCSEVSVGGAFLDPNKRVRPWVGF